MFGWNCRSSLLFTVTSRPFSATGLSPSLTSCFKELCLKELGCCDTHISLDLHQGFGLAFALFTRRY